MITARMLLIIMYFLGMDSAPYNRKFKNQNDLFNTRDKIVSLLACNKLNNNILLIRSRKDMTKKTQCAH
ncbi:hypothetical protein GCM10008931_26220 [Oceanobacillus oncorhynchi subsp. oncorhynchi]